MHRKFSSFNLLPNVIQSSINEVLCKNIFDHFINEKEETYVFGALSNDPQDSDKIVIDDSHYHLHQLQPIFKVNDSSYTFRDILLEMEKQGTYISDFDQWGNASFLNFMPPINLDKFNNFYNYVWVDLDTQPHYVCIRSPLIHDLEHKLMVARKMSATPINIVSTTTNSITFEGNCAFIFDVDPQVIISDSTSNDGTYTVSSTTTSYDSVNDVHYTTVSVTASIQPSTSDGYLTISNITSS